MDINAAVSSPAYEGPELKFKTSAENLTWKYSFFSSSQSQGFKDQALGNSPQLVGRYCSYLLPEQAFTTFSEQQ